MKIVINRCYGGFCLSKEAMALYEQLHPTNKEYNTYSEDRNDPVLVTVVETLGEKANGYCSKLNVVEIPDDVKWTIESYDGKEKVSEVHQTWM